MVQLLFNFELENYSNVVINEKSVNCRYCNLSVTFSKYYVHVLQKAGEYYSIEISKNIDFLTLHCFEFSCTMYYQYS